MSRNRIAGQKLFGLVRCASLDCLLFDLIHCRSVSFRTIFTGEASTLSINQIKQKLVEKLKLSFTPDEWRRVGTEKGLLRTYDKPESVIFSGKYFVGSLSQTDLCNLTVAWQTNIACQRFRQIDSSKSH